MGEENKRDVRALSIKGNFPISRPSSRFAYSKGILALFCVAENTFTQAGERVWYLLSCNAAER